MGAQLLAIVLGAALAVRGTARCPTAAGCRKQLPLDGEPLIPYGLGFDGSSTEVTFYLCITRPVGSAGDSLGPLIVTHDGVASAPFDVAINSACKQETTSGALRRSDLAIGTHMTTPRADRSGN